MSKDDSKRDNAVEVAIRAADNGDKVLSEVELRSAIRQLYENDTLFQTKKNWFLASEVESCGYIMIGAPVIREAARKNGLSIDSQLTDSDLLSISASEGNKYMDQCLATLPTAKSSPSRA